MKYKKPVAFNYVQAMRHIKELEIENRELKEIIERDEDDMIRLANENRVLRANLEIKEENRMRRVKTKPKKRKVVMGGTELNKLKRDVTKEATDKACLIVLAAMVDELKINEEQLCAVMERTDRYANHIDNHFVKMEDIRKTIENGTGIKDDRVVLMGKAKGIIVKRECDEPMARSMGLIGKESMQKCNKECRKCLACIETDIDGNRGHVDLRRGRQ